MIKSKIFILLLFQGGIILSQDVGKTSFSLFEAQEYAVNNHLRYKNAELELQESKRKVQEIAATGLPQISASADYKYNIHIPVSVVDARAFNPNAPEGEVLAFEFGQTNNTVANLFASQQIFDGTYIVGLRAARTYKELKLQGITKTEIDIRDAVARAYYNVLVAEQNQQIFSENVDKIESQLSDLRAMYESGFIEELDVDQLELLLADAKYRKQTIQRQVDISYQMLNFQMGQEIDSELELTDNLEGIYQNYDEEALLSKELQIENHIDYKMMETQEQLSMHQIRRDRFSRLPLIKASYSYSQTSYVNILEEQQWFKSSFVGLNVSIPIFTSTMNMRKVQQGKLQLYRIQNNKTILEDNLRLEVSMARNAYIDALEQFQTEEKNMSVSKKIFEVTTEKQRNGMASSMDVTVANNQYLNTQGKYIQSIYRILEAKATLDKALNNY